jgi:hypothetical protein
VPAFFDADGDGDFDMFVGYFTRTFVASIAYFENTGSASQPAFKLITDDFFGIAFSNLFNIKPAFVDLNGDTKVDLVFTGSSLSTGATFIYYMLNANGIGLNFPDVPQILFVNGLNLLQSETICFTDVDGDSKSDILIGRQNGSLQYWKNIGEGLPGFVLEETEFLGMGISTDRRSVVCAVGDLNADRKLDLILSDHTGVMTIVGDYLQAIDLTNAETNIVFNTKLDRYHSRNLGGKAWPTIVNIFKTDMPSIVVGNVLGGLQILRNDEGKSLPETPVIDIFPNPVSVKSDEKIRIKIDRPSILLVYSIVGQEVGDPIYLQAFQEYEFATSSNHKGIYIFRFFVNGKSYSRRVVIK